MTSLITHARNALAAVGILEADNKLTALTSLFSTLPNYHRILVSGLDCTGKSTLLEKHLASDIKHVSTFTIFTVLHIDMYRCGNVTFHVMDIGAGRPNGFHTVERAFFSQTNAIVWVVDANNCDTHLESREELAGKLDHEDCMSSHNIEIVEKIRISFFSEGSPALSNRPHEVFGTNIHKGEGLREAFEWLSTNISGGTKNGATVDDGTPIPSKDEEVVMIIENGLGRG